MDLIYTNANREDVGVLQDYELDLAFGADENNFECTIPASSHCCEAGSLLYMEGTEYGGIVDCIESKTDSKEVVYSGRTWHGILGSKVIEPLKPGEAKPQGRLPHGFTELTFIESTGTQYIDTDFNTTQNSRFSADIEYTEFYSDDYNWFMGDRQEDTQWLVGFKTATASMFANNPWKTYYAAGLAIGERTTLTVDFKNQTFSSSKTENVAITVESPSTKPPRLFIGNVVTFTKSPKCKCYGVKFYDDDILVRDFVPCKDAAGNCGLYDVVNSAFYGNAGSGNFVEGETVEYESSGVAIKETDSGGNSLIDRYLVISGDANVCVQFILDRIGLSGLFAASLEAAGEISQHQFNRFTDAYSGLMKMLASAGMKLKVRMLDGQVVLSAEAQKDYSADEEFDSDLIDFCAKKKYQTVNHLICLGKGELENRTVIHLYADAEGNISQTQTLFGLEECVDVYDYSNVESEEELISSGKAELKKMWTPDSMDVDFDATSDIYDVGDTVGAVDNITGIAVLAVITKKIVTIKNGQTTISYKVGE